MNPLPNLILPLLLIAGLTLALLGLFSVAGVDLSGISSSTEAWLLAHVLRVGWLGDPGLAAAVGSTPNLAFDPLYPWLLSPFAPTGPGAPATTMIQAAHGLAALGWGLAAAALFQLWRAATGSVPAGLAGASALLLPPMVGTAALARYDSLGIGLALVAAWLGLSACCRPGPMRFALAGAAVGLCHLTREYLALPALGSLVVALVLAFGGLPRWRRGQPRAWLPSLFGALGGLGLGAVPLPLALGLSPLAGIEALLHYGGQGRAAAEASPGPLWLCLVGGLGLACRIRGDRRALALLGGLVLPFAGFLFSDQQSPQYYLLAAVVLLSGIGGLVAALPGRILPGVASATLVIGGMGVGMIGLKTSLSAPGPRVLGFHSEVWPCPAAEVVASVDQAGAWAKDGPLLLVSGSIENIDGLAWIHLSRPVAFAYPFELDKLDRLAPEFRGADVAVVRVERAEANSGATDAALDRWQGNCLTAILTRLPGQPLDHPGGCGPEQPRGACAQAWWLAGGLAGLREGARAFQDRWRPELLGFWQ